MHTLTPRKTPATLAVIRFFEMLENACLWEESMEGDDWQMFKVYIRDQFIDSFTDLPECVQMGIEHVASQADWQAVVVHFSDVLEDRAEEQRLEALEQEADDKHMAQLNRDYYDNLL